MVQSSNAKRLHIGLGHDGIYKVLEGQLKGPGRAIL